MNHFCLGVDLATEQDFTAISLIEHKQFVSNVIGDKEGIKLRHEYHLRHLERLPLNTGYNEIISAIKMRMAHPDLEGKCTLAVDRTGVGNPVMTMLRNEGLSPIGIYITAGNTTNTTATGYNVPKNDLVSALSILFQSGRLHASPTLGFQKEFREELQNFRLKKTPNGSDTYSAWRESVHDDLVLSVAISCYLMMKMHGETTYSKVIKREKYNVFSALGI